MRAIIDGIVHLFYPSLCEGCSRQLTGGETVLCLGCENELTGPAKLYNPENEAGLRFAGRVPFQYAASFAPFVNDGLLQHLIHGLKYRGKRKNGIYLGNLLGAQLQGYSWIKDIDLVAPVPLNKKKEAKRGYNQSRLIAQGISQTTGIPVADDVLERVKNTESQTQKSRDERVANMAGAFCIKNTGRCSNKHILLCDDVLTTGATLESCAIALLEEGTVKISLVTIGIAIS